MTLKVPEPGKKNRTARDKLAAVVSDMVSDLLYYDRKEDEDLPRGAIDDMVRKGEVQPEEIVQLFRDELFRGLK